MRISVRTADGAAHQTYRDECAARGGPPSISVNGAAIANVIVADDGEGYVLAVAQDEARRFKTDAQGIVTQELRGAVVIRWPA